MKLLIYFAATLTFSLSALAQKPMTRNWRDKKESIVKLSYFIPEATWASQLSASYVRASAKFKSGGTSLGDYTTDGYLANATLGYGISPNFSLAVSWGYLFEQQVKYENFTPASANGTVKFRGHRDPILGGIWRFFDNGQGTSVKSALTYSPSLGKSKSGSTTEDGNALNGGDEAMINFTLTTSLSPMTEMAFTLQRDQNFVSKTESGAETDGYGSTSIQGRFLHDTDGGFYFGGGLSVTSSDSYSSKSSTGTKSDNPSRTSTSVFFEAAADLDANNGLSGMISTTIPRTEKTSSGADIEYNQSLGLTANWTHQF